MDNSFQFLTAMHSLQQRAYYPSPFFDVARLYMPNNVKEMFKWCRFYFYTHPVVSQVITRLAEYPITDFVIDTSDKEIKEKYLEIFRVIKMRAFLIKFALDYFVYGNCFASIHFPFSRFLGCKLCGQKVNIRDIQYKIYNYTPKGVCKKCCRETEFNIDDVRMGNTTGIRLRTWNPLNIDIEYNEISGERYYYYLPSGRVRRGIMSGSPVYWESTPMWVIEAIKDNKVAQFTDGKIFHFARPSVTDELDEWGKSIILPVLREIFHFYTLRKAQESICIDRIIPLRFLYPETQAGNIEPLYIKADLGEWKERIEEELKKWKADPLYISIMPFPVGMDTIGGEAKALMVFPEMEATSNMIENGLGMPSGFMRGQITYSGGNVVLRMMENSFITDRDQREEFLQWATNEISSYLKTDKLTVKMKDFRMAEEMEKKHLLASLNDSGKLSDDTFLSEFDLSAKKEMEKIMQESADKQEKYLEVNVRLSDSIRGWINQLNEMDEEQRNMIMSRMQQEMPNLYATIAPKIALPASNRTPNEAPRENPVMPPEAGGASANR